MDNPYHTPTYDTTISGVPRVPLSPTTLESLWRNRDDRDGGDGSVITLVFIIAAPSVLN